MHVVKLLKSYKKFNKISLENIWQKKAKALIQKGWDCKVPEQSAVLWDFHGRFPKPMIQSVTCDCLLPEDRNYWFGVQLFFLISNKPGSDVGQMVKGWGAILMRITIWCQANAGIPKVVWQMEMCTSWRSYCKYVVALEDVDSRETLVFYPLEIFRTWLESSLNPNLISALFFSEVLD